MARPKSNELTDRELAVMQVFWKQEDASAEDAREFLVAGGEDLAYVTVANVVRSLADKGFLKQITPRRPFRYRAVRSFDEVSHSLVGDLVSRVFNGSREAMLVQLFDRRELTSEEREYLESLLERQELQAYGEGR